MIFHVKEDRLISGDGNDTIGHNSFRYITGKYINLEKRLGRYIRLERRSGHLYIIDQYPIVGEKYKLNGKKYICSQFQSLFHKDEEVLLTEDEGMSILAHTGEIELA